ncbi:MAG: hypothetical protein SVG88_14105 [Halobacteriales archaeon]|nr:hypothetical protein [Halobacteriales archaeon]
MVFDDQFTSEYPKSILEQNPSHGDIVFGGRRSVRGVVSRPFDRFDGNFQRALRKLESIDRAPVFDLQEQTGPVTLYSENMVYHSVDYGYTKDPPPPLIGFDIHASAHDPKTSVPTDPFADDFQGFFAFDQVTDVFDAIGLPIVNQLEATPPVDPEEFTIPMSELGDVEAEGIVFRSDELGIRAKKVSERHREINRRIFGGDPAKATSGAEYLAEKFCTPARIRKQIHRLLEEEDKEFGLHLNEELYPRVVEDIWREEWPTIMQLDRELTPAELYPIVADRCIEQLRQMDTNAELNDVEPLDLWRAIWDPDTDPGADDQ